MFLIINFSSNFTSSIPILCLIKLLVHSRLNYHLVLSVFKHSCFLFCNNYNTPPSYFFYGDTNYKVQRSNYKVQHKDQRSRGKPKPIGRFQRLLTRILYAEAYRILDNMPESMPFTQLQMQRNDTSLG